MILSSINGSSDEQCGDPTKDSLKRSYLKEHQKSIDAPSEKNPVMSYEVFSAVAKSTGDDCSSTFLIFNAMVVICLFNLKKWIDVI